MKQRHRISAMAEFILTTADPASALASLSCRNIPVFQISYLDELTVAFLIRGRDLSAVKQWASSRGETLQLRKKRGLLWQLTTLKSRKLLVSGFLLWLCFVLWLPGKVLFVQVEGNKTVPAQKILSAAEECGIRFLADRREVRSEKMKNSLLSAIPQLQWAGINTKGCVAVISVRERLPETKTKASITVSSIVALRDGVIDSCTATKGNLLCAPGQTVNSGQVLISGYTDCGLYLRATQAEGEIYALTNREIRVLSPQNAVYLSHPAETKRKVSLIIGKKRINLWKDSGIWPTTCGRIYEEYYVTLPGGFSLPCAIAVDTCEIRQTEQGESASAQASLQEVAQQYLLQQMIAGQIVSSREEVSETEETRLLSGRYICREMIGRVQQEQIGENYVENN